MDTPPYFTVEYGGISFLTHVSSISVHVPQLDWVEVPVKTNVAALFVFPPLVGCSWDVFSAVCCRVPGTGATASAPVGLEVACTLFRGPGLLLLSSRFVNVCAQVQEGG